MLQYREVDFVAAHYRPNELVLAGPGRRLASYVLESLLQAFALIMAFVGLGAPSIEDSGSGLSVLGAIPLFALFGWFLFAAQNGQTPGKQLLGMYVLRADGTRAGFWYVLLRELVVKGIVGWILTFVTLGFYGLFAGLWCLWDPDNQCLWDKIVSTYVAWSPYGFRPANAHERRAGGLPPASGSPLGPSPVSPRGPRFPRAGSRDIEPTMARNVAGLIGRPRIAVIDHGSNVGEFELRIGQAVTVGRADDADIRLSDPRVSRRHLQIEAGATSWLIGDLGATNPAQVIAGGPAREIRGVETLDAGQVAVGESVITLYPFGS